MSLPSSLWSDQDPIPAGLCLDPLNGCGLREACYTHTFWYISSVPFDGHWRGAICFMHTHILQVKGPGELLLLSLYYIRDTPELPRLKLSCSAGPTRSLESMCERLYRLPLGGENGVFDPLPAV